MGMISVAMPAGGAQWSPRAMLLMGLLALALASKPMEGQFEDAWLVESMPVPRRNHDNCPKPECAEPPSQCPPGSSLKVQTDENGCEFCMNCLDGDGKAVAVPSCWQRGGVRCATPMCPTGTMLTQTIAEGPDGSEPCCAKYECK